MRTVLAKIIAVIMLLLTVSTGSDNTYKVTAHIVGNVFNGTEISENTYDAEGKLVYMTDTNGNVTAYTYDEFGNLESKTVQNKTTTYTHELDMNNKPISTVAHVPGDDIIGDYDADITYEYGTDYELLSEKITYSYSYLDPNGNEVTVDLSEVKIYTYDELGHVATMYHGYKSVIGDFITELNTSYWYEYEEL